MKAVWFYTGYHPTEALATPKKRRKQRLKVAPLRVKTRKKNKPLTWLRKENGQG
jgi:hypothetical protein